MYKVFYNDRVIILVEKSKKPADKLTKKEVKDRKELFGFLDKLMMHELNQDVVVSGYDLQGLFGDFKSWFKYVEAAGGIVQNSEGKFLFIKRWNMWDLPKGKIEKGESAENAAIREIEEETGVRNLVIRKKTDETYHIYQVDQQFYLKCTFWYLMFTEKSNKTYPQLDEGIEEVAWYTKQQSSKLLAESYRSLKETLRPVFM